MRYILFHKPYAVLTQFSPAPGKRTLKDFLTLPKSIYPVGRLDYDSEGLLLLTDDNVINHRFTDPKFEHPRTYLAQVERIPSAEALEQLRTGVVLGGRRTLPAAVSMLPHEPDLPPRSVPIRFRKTVPTAWLTLTLTEGKNRQVRKMTAAIGHPTLRLVRIAIGNVTLGSLRPGEWKELSLQQLLSGS